jgi:HEAT repeat protein
LNVLKLWKTSRDGQGKTFKKKEHPVSFWQDIMQAKDEAEFLAKIEDDKKHEEEVRKIRHELYELQVQSFERQSGDTLSTNEQRRIDIIRKIKEDPHLSQYLSDSLKSPKKRFSAALTFVLMAEEKGIEPLFHSLKEGIGEMDNRIYHTVDIDSRIIAAISLMLFEIAKKNGQAIDPLIWILKNDMAMRVRANAALALGEIKGYPRVIDALIEALNDYEEHEDVRKGSFLGIPLLVGTINVRQNAVRALKKIVDEGGLKAIISPYLQKLKDHDWKTRKRAIEEIAEWGGAQTIQLLTDSLKDEHWEVRKTAAESLGKIKDVTAVEGLALALKDESVDVRKKVVEALKKIKDFRAVEPLIQALNDESIDVRQQVALALGDFGDPRAIKALTKAKEDKSWWVRNAAKSALTKIQSK